MRYSDPLYPTSSSSWDVRGGLWASRGAPWHFPPDPQNTFRSARLMYDAYLCAPHVRP